MLYSYVAKRAEDGGWTGVSRFDAMLRRVFPGMRSMTLLPVMNGEDVVVTDNHLSCDVPERVETVVVHHGCAATHFSRDPQWRTNGSRKAADKQVKMFFKANRRWVAPSAWVADEFSKVIPDRMREVNVIPHWVQPISPLARQGKPRIIGDWRDHNKGAIVWRKLAERYSQWEFQPLNFRDDAGRCKQYGEASLYLCLSLSEGGAYSVCDAEAAELPIVTTDVGNYREFKDCEVIRWQDRNDLEAVGAAIERKLKAGRCLPSFYRDYTFEHWVGLWREVVAQ